MISELQTSYDNALKEASENGLLKVIEYLVENGANIHVDSNYCIRKASENNHLEVVKYLIDCGGNTLFIRNPLIRNELGIPKWRKKPDSLEFRENTECSISGELLNENVSQLGCPSCKNTFKLDALENWLNIHYRCPFCSSTNEFFLV